MHVYLRDLLPQLGSTLKSCLYIYIITDKHHSHLWNPFGYHGDCLLLQNEVDGESKRKSEWEGEGQGVGGREGGQGVGGSLCM